MDGIKVHPLQLDKLHPLPELLHLVYPFQDPMIAKTIDLVRWYFEVIEHTEGNDYTRFMINSAWFSAMQDGGLFVKVAPEFNYCFTLTWDCPSETSLILCREESAIFRPNVPLCCTISWKKILLKELSAIYPSDIFSGYLLVRVPTWFKQEILVRIEDLWKVCRLRYPEAKDVCYYPVFTCTKEGEHAMFNCFHSYNE